MTKHEHKFIKGISGWVYKKFCTDSGNMLLGTSIIGTTLSSIAQAAVVYANDKYTVAQKAFMIPQELVECTVSAVSIFAITKPIQKVAKKAVSTGKILPKGMTDYLKKYNLSQNIGKKDFNIGDTIKALIEKNQVSKGYHTKDVKTKDMIVKEHKDALLSYNNTYDAVSAISATVGTAISVAVAVPTIRNTVAAYFQKQNMRVYNSYVQPSSTSSNRANMKI